MKRRILIIDDDVEILDTLEFALTEEGFEVVTATCGEQALAAAAEGELHAAITDLRMDGMSGQDTLAGLKRLQPGLRVLVMTGYATCEAAAECEMLGACGVLRKPFDLEDLLSMLAPSN
jgi:two-component system response regulator PilR (NtrC family)